MGEQLDLFSMFPMRYSCSGSGPKCCAECHSARAGLLDEERMVCCLQHSLGALNSAFIVDNLVRIETGEKLYG